MTELWTIEEIALAAQADAGELDTGSYWDGWHIVDVYEDLKAKHGQRIAREQTRQIRENRLAAITMNGNGRNGTN